MSLTGRIFAALVAGLVSGVLVARYAGAAQDDVLSIAGTVGAAWIDGLRMTIVPLVFALLVTGVATAADAARAGGVAAKTLLLFTTGLIASAFVAGLLTLSLLTLWPPPAGAAGLLASGSGLPAETAPIGGDWLLSFIPANPIKAAAEGQMAPLVVFALLFGFAVATIGADRREGLVNWFQSVLDVLLVIVRWVLWLAPLGVFALALTAGARAGLSALGALAHYVILIVAACLVVTLLTYPVVMVAGRIGLGRFARAAAPAQVIAFSTQSSIASLPAMLEAAGERLGVAEPVRNLVLPMAVSIFRITSAAANFAVALYLAALHGVEVGPGLFAIGLVVAALVSLAAVGLPSQVSFFAAIAPICLAMGVPVELLPLLLAVETIPDIFRTVGNVTADLAVTRIVAAGSPSDVSARPADEGSQVSRKIR